MQVDDIVDELKTLTLTEAAELVKAGKGFRRFRRFNGWKRRSESVSDSWDGLKRRQEEAALILFLFGFLSLFSPKARVFARDRRQGGLQWGSGAVGDTACFFLVGGVGGRGGGRDGFTRGATRAVLVYWVPFRFGFKGWFIKRLCFSRVPPFAWLRETWNIDVIELAPFA